MSLNPLSLFSSSGSYHIYVIYQPSFTKPTINPKGLNNSAYSSPDPNVEASNQTLSLFNQTQDTDSNLTSANLTDTVVLGNQSSEMKEEALTALQVAGVTDPAPYCDRTLYLFAFWTTTLVYGFAALGLGMSACFYCCITLTALLTSCVSWMRSDTDCLSSQRFSWGTWSITMYCMRWYLAQSIDNNNNTVTILQ